MVKIKPLKKIKNAGKKASQNKDKSKVKDRKKQNFRISSKKTSQKISPFKKFIKNPSINHFNLDSNFIYDLDEVDNFFNKTKDKNLLKVTKKELDTLDRKINEISLINDIKNKTTYISIKKETLDIIRNYLKVKEINDPLTSFIKNNLEDKDKRIFLSSRKIANLYFEKTGKKTNRTTVNTIIRKKLGFHYLKTIPKNKIIKKKDNLLICFAFIKIVMRCLVLGFDIIFLDESTVINKNNHFRCIRKINEQIYYEYDKLSKANLLMAVNEKGIVHFELKEESTNQNSFLNFMNNFLLKIKEKPENKYVIIMDNLPVHKTSKLIKFYTENKINVIFNCPYLSEWNCIELAFRALKKQYYQKLFKSIVELKSYVIDILNSENYANTLSLNFGETLREYKKFILENEKTNLNLMSDL